jgi:hypothetical protein
VPAAQLIPLVADPAVTDLRAVVDDVGHNTFPDYDPALLISVTFAFDGATISGIAGAFSVSVPAIPYSEPAIYRGNDFDATHEGFGSGDILGPFGLTFIADGVPINISVTFHNWDFVAITVGNESAPIGAGPLALGYILVPPPIFAQAAQQLLEGRSANRLFITCMEVGIPEICAEESRVALPYNHSFTCPENDGWYYPTGYGSDCYHDTYFDRFPFHGARHDCFYTGETIASIITVQLPGSLWDPGFGTITARVEVWSGEFGIKIGESPAVTIVPAGVIASPVFICDMAPAIPAHRTFSLRFVLLTGGGNASMPNILVDLN